MRKKMIKMSANLTTELKKEMAEKNERRNLNIRAWVDNALTNLAKRKGVEVPEYINDLLKLHVISNDCDELGNLPGMTDYQGSIKGKHGL